jgi:peroxiredoxin
MTVEKGFDFELPDHEGNTWRLADHLSRGPVLLGFYRGDW